MDGKRLGIVVSLLARLLLFTLLALALSLPPLQTARAIGVVRYAKAGGLLTGSCTSWSTACWLRYALTKAVSGDQVWVVKGTHTPGSGRSSTFRLKNGVAIYGGFVGTETTLGQRDWVANVTILSGDVGDPGLPSDNAYHVVTGSSTDHTAILDGFKIVGGYANGTGFPAYHGGGLLNNFGSPTLRNLSFADNFAAYYGGGMGNLNSSPIVKNVTFSTNTSNTWGGGMGNAYNSSPALTAVSFLSNSADHGGGMYNADNSNPTLTGVGFTANTAAAQGGAMENSSSSPVLVRVTFTGNQTDYYGGGIYNFKSSPSLTYVSFNNNTAGQTGGGISNNSGSNPLLNGVTFSGNSAGGYYGGGIYNHDSSPALRNVTFSGNSAFYGGGVYNDASNPSLRNVTFSGNTATAPYGGAMYNGVGSTPLISNSILWNDGTAEVYDTADSAPTIAHSIVAGGCPGGATCTVVSTGDPKLGILQDNGGFTKTIALGAASAAIDKGQTASCTPTDQRGLARPQGTACDIGAYEVRAVTYTSLGPQDGHVLESGLGTDAGGVANATAVSFLVGDSANNRRLRGFLSFNTADIPDAATVVMAKLKVKEKSVVGDPFGTQGPLGIDLDSPYFGTGAGLAASDWEHVPLAAAVGSFGSTLKPVNSWYGALINSAGTAQINKTGTTQFRLAFSWETYNAAPDYLAFYSGNDLTSANHPILIVYYNP